MFILFCIKLCQEFNERPKRDLRNLVIVFYLLFYRNMQHLISREIIIILCWVIGPHVFLKCSNWCVLLQIRYNICMMYIKFYWLFTLWRVWGKCNIGVNEYLQEGKYWNLILVIFGNFHTSLSYLDEWNDKYYFLYVFKIYSGPL